MERKSTTMLPERIGYLDCLRLWAMTGVIVIHQAATGYSTAAAGSTDWAVCLLYSTLARFSVPVFVMISGAVFLDPQKPAALAQMLPRIGRLAVLFLCWSLFYALPQTLAECGSLVPDQLLLRLLKGHYHMWYLHLMMVLYLLTPLLRRETWRRILMPIAFLLGFGAAVLPGVPVWWSDIAYLGYYCLGHRLHNMKHSGKRTCGLMVASLAFLATAAVFCLAAERPELIFRETTPHILMLSAAVFLLAKDSCHGVPSWTDKIVSCGRGIYLIHPVFNFLLRRAGLYALTFGPVISVALCSLLVGAMSYAAVRTMKGFPFLRHFV